MLKFCDRRLILSGRGMLEEDPFWETSGLVGIEVDDVVDRIIGLVASFVADKVEACVQILILLQTNIRMNMSEGRFVLGTFRSERMRVPYRSRQNDRLRVMLVLVHIDITPPQVIITLIKWNLRLKVTSNLKLG
ncbi:hypothetical protein TNCV_4968471 [Trichonephila clavipes]|nr:hypothetical protein TNCV_4968471 [Trichonephila clavipes]